MPREGESGPEPLGRGSLSIEVPRPGGGGSLSSEIHVWRGSQARVGRGPGALYSEVQCIMDNGQRLTDGHTHYLPATSLAGGYKTFTDTLINWCTLIFTARKRSCGKVMFLRVSMILFTIQVCSRGVPGPGGCLVPGGSAWSWGGCLVLGGSAPGGTWSRGCLLQGGAWWRPPDGYCCGRYTSYWNAFLLCHIFTKKTT